MLRSLLLIAILSCPAIAQPPDNPGKPAPIGTIAPPPPTLLRTPSGKCLMISEAVAKVGKHYDTVLTDAKQVSFISDGKIRSEGHSSGVIGYAVAGPADNP